MSGKLLIIIFAHLANFVEPVPQYTFPTPILEAFQPQGLKVTLAHTPADKIFAFHANVNKPISQGEVGELAQEVSKRVKGQWVVNFPEVRLQTGDKIYFWLFVSNKHFGYEYIDGVYEVKDLHTMSNSKRPVTTECDNNPNESATICEQALVTLTRLLLESQKESASLRERTTILKNIIQENSKLSTSLILEGLVAPDNEIGPILEAIICNKLDLCYLSVSNITKLSDAKIQFQVRNLDDKLQVIEAAKEKLEYSRYKITY